jgi:hypothetical protein
MARNPKALAAHCATLILIMAFGNGLTAKLPADQLDEYQVKAAFLYNFARFVEWPEAIEDASKPFVICVLGKDPFGRTLDDIVSGKKIQARPFAVRRFSDPAQARGCSILFVSSSERKNVISVLGSLNEPGILTVGESDTETSDGVIVRFTMADGKVRFEINSAAASRAMLHISAKLLSLAQAVRR